MIPKKPALGLDPRGDTGFRKRSCSTNKLERDDDSKKSHPALSGLTRVDPIGAPLEGRGEAPEGGVEHRAHEQLERPALELVGDEELDVAGLLAGRMEVPAVLELAERALEILDMDLQIGPVEGDAAREDLVHELVAHRHVGDDDFDAFRLGGSAAHPEPTAQRHEFRIMLDVG